VITTTGEQTHGDVVLWTWTGDSAAATVRAGVDTHIISDGRILVRTTWFALERK